MSQGKLQHIIASFRAQLAQHEATAERALSDAYANTLKTIQPALDRLYKQIADKQSQGQDIPISWLHEEHRLESIKALVTHQVNRYGQVARIATGTLQDVGVQLGGQAAQSMLKATVPTGVNWSFGMPSTDAIANLVGATQQGSPLYDLFATFGPQAADDVSQALVTGITLGNGPAAVARDVAQALDVPRWRALTFARDGLNNAYRGAALENYRANDDVVDGYIRLADLSPRTCAACIALSGTEYQLDDDPGFHPNDRCSLVPKTKSWSDILGPLGIDTSDLPDTQPVMQSGSDWFDSQSEKTQQAILGKAKYAAFKNGDFALSDIVGHSHSQDWGHSIYEKSLKELVKR